LKTLIINFKNYREVLGEESLVLARAAATVAGRIPVEVIVAPPVPMLGAIARAVGTRVKVFSQTVSPMEAGASTGAVVPEAVSASGATGTLLNHSESPLSHGDIASLLPRLRRLRLSVCLCAKSASEALELCVLKPHYIAVEPPELIGSGVAVSKAMPTVISDTVSRLRGAGYRGRILCGAGIVDGRDVESSVALGAQGVLVASTVAKARDWVEKITELSTPLA
jgi:triosephosphate isomerase